MNETSKYRRAGIILISTGLGISVCMGLMSIVIHPIILGVASVGLIPIFIGIGFFIEAFFIKRNINK